MGSDDANVLTNICSVFKTSKFNCSFSCFVMKDFWEHFSKRMRFSIFIEFDISSAEEIKTCTVCKRLFFDEWSIKRVVELELLSDSLLPFEYIISFWGAWFSLELSFLTGLILDSQIEMSFSKQNNHVAMCNF